MDPEDRKSHQFLDGDLMRRDLTSLGAPAGPLPFDRLELLARLDEEAGERSDYGKQ